MKQCFVRDLYGVKYAPHSHLFLQRLVLLDELLQLPHVKVVGQRRHRRRRPSKRASHSVVSRKILSRKISSRKIPFRKSTRRERQWPRRPRLMRVSAVEAAALEVARHGHVAILILMDLLST